MSEVPRTTQEIQTEYQNLAFKAGNLQFAIFQQQKDLDLINQTLRELNFEYVSASEAAKAEENKPEKQADAAPGTPVEAATEGSAA